MNDKDILLVFKCKSKYKKVGVPPIRIVKSNVSNVRFDEGSTLETLDFTIRIGSTPTFLYLYLYINTVRPFCISFIK